MTVPTHHPTTFKTRHRRLSPSRAALHEERLAAWGLAVEGPDLDLYSVFPTPVESVLIDIGVGGGESALATARQRPRCGVVAVEVHTPGISAILHAVATDGLPNVRVVEGDVLTFLERVAPGSVDEVRILFPDPWPKRRHHRRRLLQPTVVQRVVDLLRPDGRLYLATDDLGYARAMVAVCEAEPRLHGGLVEGGADPAANRPRTRYENRAIRAGRTVTDLVYFRY